MMDARGIRNLRGVHPRLEDAVRRAAARAQGVWTIIDGGGARTPAQAADNAARNTGVKNSLHILQADGYSWAVDVLPVNSKGGAYWDVAKAKEFNALLFEEADKDDFPLQNGADWDLDGIYGEKGEWDWHHTQIPRAFRMATATAAMARRKAERAVGISPDITPGLKPEDMKDEDFAP